jgi:hypothetical protein
LAYRNFLKPGILSARYESISGGRENRLELYLARKHLYYTPEEWAKLPWWQRQTFLEGLEEEGIIGDEEGNAVNPDYSSKPGSESKINDRLP